jgi:hypothetical protein
MQELVAELNAKGLTILLIEQPSCRTERKADHCRATS